jgi:hypothetical protein
MSSLRGAGRKQQAIRLISGSLRKCSGGSWGSSLAAIRELADDPAVARSSSMHAPVVGLLSVEKRQEDVAPAIPAPHGQVEQDRRAVLFFAGFTHVFGAWRDWNFERKSNPESRLDLPDRYPVEAGGVPRRGKPFVNQPRPHPVRSVPVRPEPFGVVQRPGSRLCVDAPTGSGAEGRVQVSSLSSVHRRRSSCRRPRRHGKSALSGVLLSIDRAKITMRAGLSGTGPCCVGLDQTSSPALASASATSSRTYPTTEE